MPTRARFRLALRLACLVGFCAAGPVACSVNPVETVDGSGRGGSASAGHAGTAGQAGTTGAAGSTGGTTGAGAQAGTTGAAGSAGGTAGSAAGAAGAAGQAGTTGTAGQGGTTGVAGRGGNTGQAGTTGAAGGGGMTGAGGQAGVVGTAGRGGATGAAGSGGAGGGKTCTQLENDYSAAFLTARSCSLTAKDQCQILVSTSLACPTCKTHVNDDTALAAIKASYDQAGCSAMTHVCPAIACVNPGSGTCVPINAGDVCM
jgi:hypothetical protein